MKSKLQAVRPKPKAESNQFKGFLERSDVDRANLDYGGTSLHIASALGNHQMVQRLLQASFWGLAFYFLFCFKCRVLFLMCG